MFNQLVRVGIHKN